MKFNKKTSFISIFAAGALIFTSAAAADVIIGNGYNSAKQAVKYTAAELTDNVDNFTVSGYIELSMDGKASTSENIVTKYDVKNKKSEKNERSVAFSGETSQYYNYEEPGKYIYKHGSDDNYYVNLSDDDISVLFSNPFEEDEAKDIERIADAFVGSMKDFVQTKENDDGGRTYFGSLNDTQIPSLVNAISSVVLKYSMFDTVNRELDIEITDNIALSEAYFQILENSDGIVTDFAASCSATGLDENKELHEAVIGLGFSITDINNTVVTEPDLTGKNVETSESHSHQFDISDKDCGIYKSNVTKLVDNKYVKTGERVLTINNVDGNSFSGHLSISGTEKNIDCDIVAKKANFEYENCYIFEYTTENGNKEKGLVRTDGYMSNYENLKEIYMDVEISENEGWTSQGEHFYACMQFE